MLADRGRKTRKLAVSHAFHSPLMQPMLADFARVAAGLTYHEPKIPIVSTVTGGPADVTGPEYWIRNVAQTVRFADAVGTLAGDGVRTFVELGPDAVLAAMTQDCLAAGSADGTVVLATQRRRHPGDRTAVEALAALHCTGRKVDWSRFFAPHQPIAVDLPGYAFTRQRYWLQPGQRRAVADPAADDFWQLVTDADADPVSLAQRLGVDPAPLAEVLPGLSAWRAFPHRSVHRGRLAVSDRLGTGARTVEFGADRPLAPRRFPLARRRDPRDRRRPRRDRRRRAAHRPGHDRRDAIADALRAAVAEAPPAGVPSLLALG